LELNVVSYPAVITNHTTESPSVTAAVAELVPLEHEVDGSVLEIRIAPVGVADGRLHEFVRVDPDERLLNTRDFLLSSHRYIGQIYCISV